MAAPLVVSSWMRRVHIQHLSQTILAKAFYGELVPTEADFVHREGRDYKPGSVLLERSHQERGGGIERQRSLARKRVEGPAEGGIEAFSY